MFDEIVRRIVFAVVWTVLVVRAPAMAFNRERRPLWVLLLVLAGGSIVIQSWFGSAINDLTGIAQFNNLVQGVWGVLDVAVTLNFATHLWHGAHWPRRRRVIQNGAAVATIGGMAVFFLLTPSGMRLRPPHAMWSTSAAYSLLAAGYMIVAAGIGSWLLLRNLVKIKGKALYIGVLMAGVGNATELPFMVIRTVQRLTSDATPELLRAALLLDTARFVLLPTGSMIAAIVPVWHALKYCYWRARIYLLWRLLRDATGELALAPPPARWRDLFTVDDAWGRLHLRLVEIRDSVAYLYDTWMSPQLVDMAARRAGSIECCEQRSIMTAACWLAAARRMACTGVDRRHHVLDRAPLAESLPDQPTMADEIRHLRRLDRAMRSPAVQAAAYELACM